MHLDDRWPQWSNQGKKVDPIIFSLSLIGWQVASVMKLTPAAVSLTQALKQLMQQQQQQWACYLLIWRSSRQYTSGPKHYLKALTLAWLTTYRPAWTELCFHWLTVSLLIHVALKCSDYLLFQKQGLFKDMVFGFLSVAAQNVTLTLQMHTRSHVNCFNLIVIRFISACLFCPDWSPFLACLLCYCIIDSIKCFFVDLITVQLNQLWLKL